LDGLRLRGVVDPDATRTIVVRPPVDFVDGRSFRWGGTVVAIAGIEVPDGATRCIADDGTAWPCADLARTSFRNLVVMRREMRCTLRHAGSSGPTAKCTSLGEDMAGLLVASGWAEPTAGWETHFEQERAAAEAGRRGLWAWRTARTPP
jgi:endonuclease YncB( thermonuclease family)